VNEKSCSAFVQNYRRRSIGSVGAFALWAQVLLITAACGQNHGNALLSVTIVEGKQFAHSVELPLGFRKSDQNTGAQRFDHYAFRLAASSPDVLLVAVSRYENPKREPYEVEVCSANSFAIDTAHSYVVHEAKQSDWDQSTPIEGFLEMNDPVRRTLKEELAKPSALRALPIGTEIEREGYKYGGKSYLRRAKWITALNFGASADRKLVVLAGYDRNKLSHGPFTLDIFDSDPTRRIAALDAESPTWVEDRLGRISIVNSRWLVVGLTLDLQQMLLFDFKPTAEQQIR
jgi:hypothetical protein